MYIPKISVVMSVYNGDKYIKEAIESILGQTFKDFEFIIIDDCSTDSTINMIENYSDNRIKLIKNKSNIGLTKNLNMGIELAKGEYIARMDADDISMPSRFEKQVKFLEDNKNISIIGSAVEHFGEKQGVWFPPVEHEEIKVSLLFGTSLPHPTVMMRKCDLNKYQLRYNEYYEKAQDYDMWVRCSRVLKLANLGDILLKNRSHSEQISSSQLDIQTLYANQVRSQQLVELGIEFNERELFIYNSLILNKDLLTYEYLKTIDLISYKIILANKKHKFYEESNLNRKLSVLFLRCCSNALYNYKSCGRYFWKSKIKKYCRISLKTKVKMYFFSFLVYLESVNAV